MTEPEQIRRYTRAVPFEPFEIHMSDGRSYVVEHPDFMMMSKDLTMVYLEMEPDEDNNFQLRVALALDHITQITENSPRRPRGDGIGNRLGRTGRAGCEFGVAGLSPPGTQRPAAQVRRSVICSRRCDA